MAALTTVIIIMVATLSAYTNKYRLSGRFSDFVPDIKIMISHCIHNIFSCLIDRSRGQVSILQVPASINFS